MPMRAIRSGDRRPREWFRAWKRFAGLGGYQLVECRMNRGNGVEHIALEHVVREFDIEFSLERQHDIDTGMRGHPGLVQVGFGRECLDVATQSAVFLEDGSNLGKVFAAHVLVALSLVIRIRFSRQRHHHRRGVIANMAQAQCQLCLAGHRLVDFVLGEQAPHELLTEVFERLRDLGDLYQIGTCS